MSHSPRRLFPVLLLTSACGPVLIGVEVSSTGSDSGTPPTFEIQSVSPDSATTTPSRPTTLRGRGFNAQLGGTTKQILFGGVPATNLVVVDDFTLRCTPPPQNAGPVDLVVDNGFQTVAAPGGFSYFSSPPRFAPNDARINTSAAGIASSADPALCCADSVAYAVWEDSRNGNLDIFFNRTTDAGASWQTADVRLDRDLPAGNFASRYPAIDCDGERVFAVWSDARNGFNDIYLNSSADGGVTWLSNDVRLDTGDTPGAAASDDPEICVQGENVFVIWYDQRNGNWHIYFNRSLDGGATWLSEDVRIDRSPIVDSAYSELFCDGDRVYAAWLGVEGTPPNAQFGIYFNRSLDAGATWLPDNVRLDTSNTGTVIVAEVKLCVDGDRVSAVWDDARGDNTQPDVYFRRSLDTGVNWLNEIRLDTGDALGATTSSVPQISCSGDTILVVWEDERIATGKEDVYFNRSTDAGDNWLPNPVPLNNALGTSRSTSPRIDSWGDEVHVVWSDTRNDPITLNADIYVNSSSDGGANWLPMGIRIDTNPLGAANSTLPQLCVDGARVYSAWRDERDGGAFGIYFNRRIL